MLMSQSVVRKGVEGSGGPVLTHRSGAEPVYLGLLLLLAFKVGIFRLDVDIVVHVMGIWWIENGFGCRFEMIDAVMQIVVVNNIGW